MNNKTWNHKMLVDIAKSPRLRLAATLTMTVIIGILSSILAAQIMPGGVLDWSLIPSKSSFWILLVVCFLWIYVQVRFLNLDESVLNFLSDDHCIAHIRKMKLEGLARTIKDDPSQAQLIDAKKVLKDLEVKSK
jgi:hypothetical protein